eukprot:m.169821 g.169821  ORF g.169821 m.169821 type:complete len:110 (+) comp14510_c0_seq3:183-512(+)
MIHFSAIPTGFGQFGVYDVLVTESLNGFTVQSQSAQFEISVGLDTTTVTLLDQDTDIMDASPDNDRDGDGGGEQRQEFGPLEEKECSNVDQLSPLQLARAVLASAISTT